MELENYLKLPISIVLCLSAGILGSTFTTTTTMWYLNLTKPWFQPPGWLFGPVWTILYILMGISLYLIWKRGFKETKIKKAVYIFLIQLFLNGLWSFAFFGFQDLLLSSINIIVLWILLLMTIWKFYEISKKAGLLLVPYLIWVTFATLLNLTIFIIN
ncbi:MAG: TspO/MBR family protein [Candidatus Aenigmatarchaeota archaeon]